MGERNYQVVSGVIFVIVGVFHLLRSIYSMPMNVGIFEVPLWVSYVAVVALGAMAYWSFSTK